jgi:hypothetical protein
MSAEVAQEVRGLEGVVLPVAQALGQAAGLALVDVALELLAGHLGISM